MNKKQEKTSQVLRKTTKGKALLWHKGNKLPIERLIELRKKNLTHQEIARILCTSREAVSRNLKKAGLDDLDIFQEEEGTILAYHRRRILSSITDKDLQKAGLSQKVVATGILMDKQMLKEGKNNRNDKLTISVEHRLIAERVAQEIGAYEIKRLSEPEKILEAECVVETPEVVLEAYRKAREKV